MEASFAREARDAADASGPSANVWSASTLLRRPPNSPVPDFAAPEAADDRVWRCLRIRAHGNHHHASENPSADTGAGSSDGSLPAQLLQQRAAAGTAAASSGTVRGSRGAAVQGDGRSGTPSLRSGSISVAGETADSVSSHGKVTSIPLRLTQSQAGTLSLLSVAERVGALSRGEALHGTIYEVIIHPAINAFAYISPRLLFMLAREILVILFQWILKWMLLDAILLPASAGLNPASALGAGSAGRAPWLDRAWASINDLTASGDSLRTAAEGAAAANDAIASAAGLNLGRSTALPAGPGGGAGGGGAGGDGSRGGGDGSGGRGGNSTGSGGGGSPAGFGPNGMIGIAAEPVWPDPSVHWSKDPNREGHVKPPQFHKGGGGGPLNARALQTSAAASSSLLQAGASAGHASKALPPRTISASLALSGISGRLAADVTASVSQFLTPRVRDTFRTRLLPAVSRTLSRRVVEAAVPRVTARTSVLLVREVTRLLLSDQRLRSKLLARLSAKLIPRLTQGITAAVATALTRDPTWDHVCFLCAEKQLYCAQCAAGKEHTSRVGWRAAYYGRYYAAYHLGLWAKLVGW